MDVQQINPSDLEIDPLNERNENIGPYKGDDSLEESIREQGLIQPPVVRPDNGTYKVIVGQRRTLAAQAVGLDNIPVIVVDWDDTEALQASITENVDAFRKQVSKSDRATAIKKLLEITGWSTKGLADELGVSPGTIGNWTERTRDEWQNTVVHVDPDDESQDETSTKVDTNSSNSFGVSQEDVEQISDTDLQTIRAATDSTEEREEAVRTVVRDGVSDRQLREAKKRAERSGDSLTKEIKNVNKESEEKEGGIKVETRVTFTGNYAMGLQKAAKESGTSEEQVVRKAIRDYLTEEGYL